MGRVRVMCYTRANLQRGTFVRKILLARHAKLQESIMGLGFNNHGFDKGPSAPGLDGMECSSTHVQEPLS